MTRICIDKGAVSPCDCKNFMKGIRTINGQYPDDNREFGILEGAGILITPETAGIRVTCTIPTADTIVAGDNIDISPGGDNELVISLVTDPEITGNLQVDGTTLLNDDLQVNGDIIQNGASYETHAEKVYTTNDYIITRDGAISALSPGDYSGFQVTKYDGTNDGRLVMDKDGVARVGDVGDEQPLLTREESANLTDGALLKWDALNLKAVDEGTVGDDTHPLKSLNGVLTAVSDELQKKLSVQSIYTSSNVYVLRYGQIVHVIMYGQTTALTITDMPKAIGSNYSPIVTGSVVNNGAMWISNNNSTIEMNFISNVASYGTLTYMTNDP